MNILISTLSGDSFYARPDSTMIRDLAVYYMPDYVRSLSAVPVLCFKSARAGKAVQEQFAHRYLGEFTCAVLLKTEISDGSPEYRFCMENSLDYTTIIPYNLISVERLDGFISETHPLRIAVNGHSKAEITTGPSKERLCKTLSMITSYCSVRTGDFIAVELSTPIPLSKEDCLTADFGIGDRIRLEIK